MDSKLYSKIKKIRKKIDKSIDKNGLFSEETRCLSDLMDELLNNYYKDLEFRKYPKDSFIYKAYERSYRALKSYTEKKHFPNVQEWNNYAQQNNYLSHISIEYISLMNWRDIETLINREIRIKVYR